MLKFTDKDAIGHRRNTLKNSSISMSEDYPGEIDRRRKVLFPIMKAAQNEGHRASLVVDKLVIDGNR